MFGKWIHFLLVNSCSNVIIKHCLLYLIVTLLESIKFIITIRDKLPTILFFPLSELITAKTLFDFEVHLSGMTSLVTEFLLMSVYLLLNIRWGNCYWMTSSSNGNLVNFQSYQDLYQALNFIIRNKVKSDEKYLSLLDVFIISIVSFAYVFHLHPKKIPELFPSKHAAFT